MLDPQKNLFNRKTRITDWQTRLALNASGIVIAACFFLHNTALAQTVDEQRQGAVESVITALEAYAADNGSYTVDGAGFKGKGLGWFHRAAGNYPASIYSALSAYLDNVPADPLHLNLSKHSSHDFFVLGCADRIAVFTRQENLSPSQTDQSWWSENNCKDYPATKLAHEYFKVSRSLDDVLFDPAHDIQRVEAVAAVISGLEAYASANGTYRVDGAGNNGKGNGWFHRSGGSYPASLYSAISPFLDSTPRDPLHDNPSVHDSNDFMVFRCLDRVAVFSVQENLQPAEADETWWTENPCRQYPITRLDHQYYQISKPLADLVNAPPDTAPDASDDSDTVVVAGEVTIDVLLNDTDVNDDINPDSVSIEGTPQHGMASVVDGFIVYKHDGTEPGDDEFSYTVTDDTNRTSAPAIVSITIEPRPATAPEATDDQLTLVRSTFDSIDIVENDVDIDNNLDPSSARIIDDPLHGTASLEDGVLTYHHDGGTSIVDSLTYRVANIEGLESDPAVVEFIISPALPPVALDESESIDQYAEISIAILDNDTTNTAFDLESIVITEPALHAQQLEVRPDGTILYIHSGNGSVEDGFSYQVMNTQGMPSNDARVTIDIKPGLIHIDALAFEGGFALPAKTYGDSSLNFAQGVIEVNGNSLFIAGHRHHDAIAEFNIPALVDSFQISELNSAGAPVQAFSSVIDRVATGNPEGLDQIVGLERVGDSLIVNAIEFYDAPADNTTTTLVLDDADNLSNASVSALHRMQGRARAAGWISSIPSYWQNTLNAEYIAGNASGDPIIGRLSVGPSAFAINLPDNLTDATSRTIEATELQGFSLANRLHDDLYNDSRDNALWTHMSRARYGFIVPGTRSYLTIGWSAGHQTGVGYKPTLEDGTECPGFCPLSSSDTYNFYWLWDMDDWERVKNGDIQPHEIEPYASGELNLPYQTATYINEVGGASYDEETGLLYISIQRANTVGFDNPPVIAVYNINVSDHIIEP